MDPRARRQIPRLRVEDHIPLTALARDTGVGLRTLQRWHARFQRRLGQHLDADDFTDAQAVAAGRHGGD